MDGLFGLTVHMFEYSSLHTIVLWDFNLERLNFAASNLSSVDASNNFRVVLGKKEFQSKVIDFDWREYRDLWYFLIQLR